MKMKKNSEDVKVVTGGYRRKTMRTKEEKRGKKCNC